VFAAELAATRKRKGWTQPQLADELGRLAAPIDQTTIAKIEGGKRGVSVDELFWFAFALGVPPLSLCLPREADRTVRLAPDAVFWARDAWAWSRGSVGLGALAGDAYVAAVLGSSDGAMDASFERGRFYFDAVPTVELETARRMPEIWDIWRQAEHLKQLAEDILFGAGHRVDPETMRPPSVDDLIDALEDLREQVTAELRRNRRAKQRAADRKNKETDQ
jgi:transcriptional regulator with XRE-family HTH domain